MNYGNNSLLQLIYFSNFSKSNYTVILGQEQPRIMVGFHPIDQASIKNCQSQIILISHLHCDHFDEKTLNKIKNNNQIAIIKDYKIKTLKRKLEKVGFSKILELKPWKKYTFSNDFEVAIIPQLSSNSSEKEEQIDYDLDTSIVIKCKKTQKVLYNNVDNPLSISFKKSE